MHHCQSLGSNPLPVKLSTRSWVRTPDHLATVLHSLNHFSFLGAYSRSYKLSCMGWSKTLSSLSSQVPIYSRMERGNHDKLPCQWAHTPWTWSELKPQPVKLPVRSCIPHTRLLVMTFQHVKQPKRNTDRINQFQSEFSDVASLSSITMNQKVIGSAMGKALEHVTPCF